MLHEEIDKEMDDSQNNNKIKMKKRLAKHMF